MAGVTTPAEPAQTAPPPPPARRGRRWLIVAVAAWALLLVGGAYWSSRHDPATVREQRSVEQAMPRVHRALGVLAAAAGPDAVLEFDQPRLTTGCRLTATWDGATYEETLRIFTPPPDAPAVLDDLAGRLPESYRTRVRRDHTIRADAGGFVGVRGGVTEPGVITLTVATGCQPHEGIPTVDTLLPPPPELVTVATPMAAALGFTAGEDAKWTAVRCDDAGHVARSVWLTSQPGTLPGPLPAALRGGLAGATPVIETVDLVAYRQGGVGIVAEVRDGIVTVAATQPCPAQ